MARDGEADASSTERMGAELERFMAALVSSVNRLDRLWKNVLPRLDHYREAHADSALNGSSHRADVMQAVVAAVEAVASFQERGAAVIPHSGTAEDPVARGVVAAAEPNAEVDKGAPVTDSTRQSEGATGDPGHEIAPATGPPAPRFGSLPPATVLGLAPAVPPPAPLAPDPSAPESPPAPSWAAGRLGARAEALELPAAIPESAAAPPEPTVATSLATSLANSTAPIASPATFDDAARPPQEVNPGTCAGATAPETAKSAAAARWSPSPMPCIPNRQMAPKLGSGSAPGPQWRPKQSTAVAASASTAPAHTGAVTASGSLLGSSTQPQPLPGTQSPTPPDATGPAGPAGPVPPPRAVSAPLPTQQALTPAQQALAPAQPALAHTQQAPMPQRTPPPSQLAAVGPQIRAPDGQNPDGNQQPVCSTRALAPSRSRCGGNTGDTGEMCPPLLDMLRVALMNRTPSSGARPPLQGSGSAVGTGAGQGLRPPQRPSGPAPGGAAAAPVALPPSRHLMATAARSGLTPAAGGTDASQREELDLVLRSLEEQQWRQERQQRWPPTQVSQGEWEERQQKRQQLEELHLELQSWQQHEQHLREELQQHQDRRQAPPMPTRLMQRGEHRSLPMGAPAQAGPPRRVVQYQ